MHGVGITLLPEGSEISVANKGNPYVAKGKHLFIFVTKDLLANLRGFVEGESGSESLTWPLLGFKIRKF